MSQPDTAVVPMKPLPGTVVPQHVQPDVMSMLAAAVDRGMSVEGLERLVALKRSMDADAARSAFNRALVAFQGECPTVAKSSKASFVTKSGGRAEYQYAELDEIKRTIGPVLQRHGLSYTWTSELTDKWMLVTCTLRHVDGHSEASSFPCPVEGSPLMSEPQKHAATLTFAMRQSLRQVAGITTGDADTDAVGVESNAPITEAQLGDLTNECNSRDIDLGKFLRFLGVTSLELLPARDFDRAMKAALSKARRS